jgi:hypothetical protein
VGLDQHPVGRTPALLKKTAELNQGAWPKQGPNYLDRTFADYPYELRGCQGSRIGRAGFRHITVKISMKGVLVNLEKRTALRRSLMFAPNVPTDCTIA